MFTLHCTLPYVVTVAYIALTLADAALYIGLHRTNICNENPQKS